MEYLVAVMIFVCVHTGRTISVHDYIEERDKIIEEEIQLQLGGKLKLNGNENLANQILMRYKRQEVDDSFQNPEYFNFSRHYFDYHDDIPRSKVYQIIRMMPKGAALHVHSSLMLSADRLLKLTYEEHLYACFASDGLKLRFSQAVPPRPCPSKWKLLSKLRNHTKNLDAFDEKLKRHFTLFSKNKKHLKKDINHTWARFNKICRTISDLITYRPVREKVFYEGLKEFYKDNIMYIEIRSGLPNLYELNGTVHDLMFMPRLYDRVTKKFKQEHPDFVGVKLIVTKRRYNNITDIQKVLEVARGIKRELPDFFAGFDLVGQEDLGKTLLDFLPVLKSADGDLNYYFHGGETNWFGTSTDENLFDAILLGTKRIGHGYALLKHPKLMAVVRAKNIAIEVNVISNNVLSLITDVRNHPLAAYLAYGMPVVLSSDDPGAWGADPLSHDFYIAFVGIASKRADLRLLKQLIINSINYSALDYDSKTKMYSTWTEMWDIFIQKVIQDFR